MAKYTLSKSTFLKGQQCLKALYLNKYHKKLSKRVTDSQQAMFDRGHRVGSLAQDYFKGGLDCTPLTPFDYSSSAITTEQAVSSGIDCLYEACFMYDGVMAAVDIMKKDGDAWDIIEVKSSAGIKDVHIWDAAIQYFILSNNGIQIKGIQIMYIDNTYILNGDLNLKAYFKRKSVLKKVLERQGQISDLLMAMKQTLAVKRLPNVAIGPHCNSPYECNFKAHCWEEIPEVSVFNLNRIGKKAFELYENGVLELKDIPEDYKLSNYQKIQVSCHVSNEMRIDKQALNQWVDEIQYPLHYFDFESIGPAIPVWQGSRPYQGVVFQYSLHIQKVEGGEIDHKEVLALPDGTDPRPEIIKNMKEHLGSQGSIMVYNISFEKSKINEMRADGYVDEATAENWVSRLVDLEDPFKKQWYYDPKMNGKSSIKNVLPALVPELSYNDLEIQDGNMANAVYEEYLAKADGHIPENIKGALLEYCKLDTFAMVKLLAVLLKAIR